MRSLAQSQKNEILLDMTSALSDKCKQFREENAEKDREIKSLTLKNERLIQATAPPAAQMFHWPLIDDDDGLIPPYNCPPPASTVAASKERVSYFSEIKIIIIIIILFDCFAYV